MTENREPEQDTADTDPRGDDGAETAAPPQPRLDDLEPDDDRRLSILGGMRRRLRPFRL